MFDVDQEECYASLTVSSHVHPVFCAVFMCGV